MFNNEKKQYCFECGKLVPSRKDRQDLNIPYGYCSNACYSKEKSRVAHQKTWSD